MFSKNSYGNYKKKCTFILSALTKLLYLARIACYGITSESYQLRTEHLTYTIISTAYDKTYTNAQEYISANHPLINSPAVKKLLIFTGILGAAIAIIDTGVNPVILKNERKKSKKKLETRLNALGNSDTLNSGLETFASIQTSTQDFANNNNLVLGLRKVVDEYTLWLDTLSSPIAESDERLIIIEIASILALKALECRQISNDLFNVFAKYHTNTSFNIIPGLTAPTIASFIHTANLQRIDMICGHQFGACETYNKNGCNYAISTGGTLIQRYAFGTDLLDKGLQLAHSSIKNSIFQLEQPCNHGWLTSSFRTRPSKAAEILSEVIYLKSSVLRFFPWFYSWLDYIASLFLRTIASSNSNATNANILKLLVIVRSLLCLHIDVACKFFISFHENKVSETDFISNIKAAAVAKDKLTLSEIVKFINDHVDDIYNYAKVQDPTVDDVLQIIPWLYDKINFNPSHKKNLNQADADSGTEYWCISFAANYLQHITDLETGSNRPQVVTRKITNLIFTTESAPFYLLWLYTQEILEIFCTNDLLEDYSSYPQVELAIPESKEDVEYIKQIKALFPSIFWTAHNLCSGKLDDTSELNFTEAMFQEELLYINNIAKTVIDFSDNSQFAFIDANIISTIEIFKKFLENNNLLTHLDTTQAAAPAATGGGWEGGVGAAVAAVGAAGAAVGAAGAAVGAAGAAVGAVDAGDLHEQLLVLLQSNIQNFIDRKFKTPNLNPNLIQARFKQILTYFLGAKANITNATVLELAETFIKKKQLEANVKKKLHELFIPAAITNESYVVIPSANNYNTYLTIKHPSEQSMWIQITNNFKAGSSMSPAFHEMGDNHYGSNTKHISDASNMPALLKGTTTPYDHVCQTVASVADSASTKPTKHSVLTTKYDPFTFSAPLTFGGVKFVNTCKYFSGGPKNITTLIENELVMQTGTNYGNGTIQTGGVSMRPRRKSTQNRQGQKATSRVRERVLYTHIDDLYNDYKKKSIASKPIFYLLHYITLLKLKKERQMKNLGYITTSQKTSANTRALPRKAEGAQLTRIVLHNRSALKKSKGDTAEAVAAREEAVAAREEGEDEVVGFNTILESPPVAKPAAAA